MDHLGTTTWSTSDVAPREATEYWRDLVCATFVQVRVDPLGATDLTGTVSHSQIGRMGVSRLTAGAQSVHRDRSVIASGDDEYLLVNIQLDGRGLVGQHGRDAVLSPRSLVFVDSSQPYSMKFTDTFAQLVIRIPQSLVPRRDLRAATAVELPGTGPAGVVTTFLAGIGGLEPSQAHELVPHALGLIDTALGWAARTTSGEDAGPAYVRERIHQFLRLHAADPELDADLVAAACGVSRRTLFRALTGGESFGRQLRRLRVSMAQDLLRGKPSCPLDVVAGKCGFKGAAQLHRAFKAVTGLTPGEYREATWHS
ncbi:AraC family transcriptional regulator [Planotetraspora sp. A-T 1434]|uniref:AraC family transcriptional regulator n=1 Tax=Planotetraspora sp. A-T 1434 TaxID=2979219 RepID=UPI0021C059F3|nr:AraC family transcriptional regulator [Planotetraspora sp. A-T 1434]MCT9931938.1 AraC family transcriptional regulator [Planotetraspora sp. A-T 1434]